MDRQHQSDRTMDITDGITKATTEVSTFVACRNGALHAHDLPKHCLVLSGVLVKISQVD